MQTMDSWTPRPHCVMAPEAWLAQGRNRILAILDKPHKWRVWRWGNHHSMAASSLYRSYTERKCCHFDEIFVTPEVFILTIYDGGSDKNFLQLTFSFWGSLLDFKYVIFINVLAIEWYLKRFQWTMIYRMIGISQSKHQSIPDDLRRYPTQKASDAERLLKGFHQLAIILL